MKGFTRNEEWNNSGKRKLGEQVVLSSTTRKINRRGGYILLWKLEGKSKISVGTLLANKTLRCYCCWCCCCHYACKAKMPSMVLISLVLFMRWLKKWVTALKMLVLFLVKHNGVEVSECLRCFLDHRPLCTWPGWADKLPLIQVCFPSLTWCKYKCVLDARRRLWSIISLSGMCTWGWLWSWARCQFSSVLLSFGFSEKGLLHKMRPSQPTGRKAPVGQSAEKIILSIVTS